MMLCRRFIVQLGLVLTILAPICSEILARHNSPRGRLIAHRKSHDRIRSGDDARPGQFPSFTKLMVTVQTPWYLPNYDKHCGATIISKYHAITAAHCVKPRESKDKIKSIYLQSFDSKNNLVRLADVGAICMLKEFELNKNTNWANDWAILTLTKRLQPKLQNIKVTNLPGHFGVTREEVSYSPNIIVTGMGKINQYELATKLQFVPVNAVCCSNPGTFTFKSSRRNYIGDLCQGDSGSGVFLNKQVGIFSKQILVGIASASPSKCDVNISHIWAASSVVHNEKKIKEMIKADNFGKCTGKSYTEDIDPEFRLIDAT